MSGLLVALVTLCLVLGVGCARPAAAPAGVAAGEAVTLTIGEGETRSLFGSGVVVTVRNVVDLTSSGCLGGPIGCRDHVELEVIQGERVGHRTLYVAHTANQKSGGIDTTEAFGYRIRLLALRGRQVTLRVSRE